MLNILQETVLLSPVYFMILFACLILCFNLGARNFVNSPSLSLFLWRFSLATLVFVFLLILNLWLYFLYYLSEVYVYKDLFFFDTFVFFLQLFLIFVVLIIHVISYHYNFIHKILVSEFIFLCFMSISGSLFLISSNAFASTYLSLELQTIPLYILISFFKSNKKSLEAGLKYFVLSIVVSMTMVFGFALLYSVTGVTSYNELHVFIEFAIVTIFRDPSYIVYKVCIFLGVFLVFVAISFKLGVIPAYFWVPEVYDAAPVSVISFMATVPKIATFGFFITFYSYVLSSLFSPAKIVILFVGLSSIIIGAVGAIYYSKLSKIIAFSGVGQLGFVYLVLACSSGDITTVATFYLTVYVFALLLFFTVWLNLESVREAPMTIFDLIGLSSQHYFHKVFLSVAVLSLAGMPPLAGFLSKLLILKCLVAGYSVIFAIIVLFVSAISFVYYLRFFKIIFFSRQELTVTFSRLLDTNSAFCGAFLVFILFVLPIFFFFF